MSIKIGPGADPGEGKISFALFQTTRFSPVLLQKKLISLQISALLLFLPKTSQYPALGRIRADGWGRGEATEPKTVTQVLTTTHQHLFDRYHLATDDSLTEGVKYSLKARNLCLFFNEEKSNLISYHRHHAVKIPVWSKAAMGEFPCWTFST